MKARFIKYMRIIAKRIFDIVFSFIGLMLLSPLIAVIAILVFYTSSGPVIFVHNRVGKNGKYFRCYKFRTMYAGAIEYGSITINNDVRITKIGRILRKYKLDELPQLWNVFCGQMSFVGPRPEVSEYADLLMGDNRRILEIMPGITGPASILFRDEENMFSMVDDKKAFNDDVIYPEKIRINNEYMHTATFMRDFGYIIMTLFPACARLIGLDRLLGLDYESFKLKMHKEAIRYRSCCN